jgi:PAS domain S-box-containing protein
MQLDATHEALNELARTRAELARTRETLRAVLDTTPDVVLRLDRELHCIAVNPMAERLLGMPALALLGRTACDLPLPEPQRSAFVTTVRHVVHSGREQVLSVHLPGALGEREFEARVVPEFDTNSQVHALLSVWREVTALARAEVERRTVLHDLLRDVAELRDDVLSSQAELRNDLLRGHAEAREAATRIFHGPPQPARAPKVQRLTARQREILHLLAAGWSNREIATELGLQTGTVKNHVATVLSKLQVADRIQAAARAVELGLAAQ